VGVSWGSRERRAGSACGAIRIHSTRKSVGAATGVSLPALVGDGFCDENVRATLCRFPADGFFLSPPLPLTHVRSNHRYFLVATRRQQSHVHHLGRHNPSWWGPAEETRGLAAIQRLAVQSPPRDGITAMSPQVDTSRRGETAFEGRDIIDF